MTPHCKDCRAEGIPGRRKLAVRSDGSPQPGPRCVTHHRAWRRRNSARAHERHISSRFELTSAEYAAILGAQGGYCAICAKANGTTRRLAVDHDHDLAKLHDHPVDRGCRLCIRGLLCKRCNRYGTPLTLPAVLRALEYLTNPPARKVLW